MESILPWALKMITLNSLCIRSFFYIGPKESSMCGQARKSGIVEVLKGHVFPQWKKRFVSIIGSQLVIFSGDAASIKTADVLNLCSANILEHTPTYNRLIIKVVPASCSLASSCYSGGAGSQAANSQERTNSERRAILGKDLKQRTMAKNNNNNNAAIASCSKWSAADCTSGNTTTTNGNERTTTATRNNSNNATTNGVKNCSSNNGELSFYNSHDSVQSTIEKETSALFFGFEDSWERDLWSAWLHEVSKFYDKKTFKAVKLFWI